MISKTDVDNKVDELFKVKYNKGNKKSISIDNVVDKIVNQVIGINEGSMKGKVMKKVLYELFNYLKKNGYSVSDSNYKTLENKFFEVMGISEVSGFENRELIKENVRYIINESIKYLDLKVIYENQLQSINGLYSKIRVNDRKVKKPEIYESNKYKWGKSSII